MPASGVSRAQENRAIRQEALRQQLAAQGHVQHVVDILDDLRDLGTEYSANEVARLKVVLDGKFRLIGKHLPDLQSISVDNNANIDDLTDEQLATRIAALSTG